MIKRLISTLVVPATVFVAPMLATKDGREFLSDAVVKACDSLTAGASLVKSKLVKDEFSGEDPEPEGEGNPTTEEEIDAANLHYAETVLSDSAEVDPAAAKDE